MEVSSVSVRVGEEQVGVLAICHDLTLQHRAQAELERQKQYWETLVQNSPVAIVTFDLLGNVVPVIRPSRRSSDIGRTRSSAAL